MPTTITNAMNTSVDEFELFDNTTHSRSTGYEALRNTRTVESASNTRLLAPSYQFHRPDLAHETAAQLLRTKPQVVAVTGRPGVGRTAFLAEVAAVVHAAHSTLRLRVAELPGGDSATELADMIDVLHAEGLADSAVLVVDNIDLRSDMHTDTRHLGVISLLTSYANEYGLRSILVYDERKYAELAEAEPVRISKLHRVQLEPLPNEALTRIVATESLTLPQLAHINTEITPAFIEHALTPPTPTDAYVHPRLALERIDTAIARAQIEQRTTRVQLKPDHLALAALPAARTATELRDRLTEVVRGQDAAIHTVADRLAPALSGLTLRPERPQGVFLFAGPSGVGKTEAAKQLARTVYGTDEALIRLDMSEYSSHEDSVMKLIGGHRIWKKSSTEGLLTTRIIQQPRTVLLLDEFEKSHPLVWPLFLQIFDEGRLTDGWGNTASFAETIIIMTSNLGVREGARPGAGFGSTQTFDSSRQIQEIERVLPAELLGRITETICFDPLDENAIQQLAHDELASLSSRLSGSGWRLEYAPEVPSWLASHRRNPALGARHLQSNIERELLPALAREASRELMVTIRGGKVHTQPILDHS